MTESVSLHVANGINTYAELFTPASPDGRAVMFTHGYTADSSGYAEFAEACADSNITCLTVDLIGHGQSSGNREDLTISNYVDGLASAYDYIAAQPGVDPSRIGAMAGSYGAYLLVLLSASRQFKSLLLRVPALYPDNLHDVPRHEFDTDTVLHMQPDPDNTALRLVHDFLGQILLVSSEHDEVIMPSTIEAYAHAIQNGKHIRMPGATHILDQPNRQAFKSILTSWAEEL